VRLRTQGFPGARASGQPVWGACCACVASGTTRMVKASVTMSRMV
jgi:hypothetical protein